MTEGIPGIIVIAVLVVGVLGAILMNSMDRPVRREKALDPDAPENSTPEKPGLELGEADVLRDVSDRSDLLPLGWGMIVMGTLVALWAWFFMDITPVDYSDTVNIDAVSQRAMLHTAGLVTAAIGAVLACAGHVVNEVRRGR